MMATRIGLEVRESDLRAVMLVSGTLRWHGYEPLSDSTSLAESVERLLAAIPRGGLATRTLGVSLGLGRAQVKRLDGLPSLRHRSQMTQLLRENTGALFLRTGAAVIPEVHQTSDGQYWGALFDITATDAIANAAQRQRLRVAAIVPAIWAFARVYPSERIVLSDGLHRMAVTYDGGELRAVQRVPSVETPLRIPAQLDAIGDDAACFVGAYAAALSTRKDPLAWSAGASPAHAAAMRRARAGLFVMALVVGCAAAIVAPALRATLFIRRESASASYIRGAEIEAARIRAELRGVAQVANAVELFDMSRGRLTRMLGQLSQAIPDSTAIVTLRVDSIEGSFVAVAPNVTDLLPELGAVEDMIDPRIAGSVTREMLAGSRLERATVRFRRSRAKTARAVTAGTRR